MKKKAFIKLIINYSAIFCALFLLLIILFSKQNRGFIWINTSFDGLDQHLVNLHLLKNFLSNLLNGHFSTFIWNIGYGMDMFANYNYYIFGDIPSYLAYFFPHDKLDILYYSLVIVRVYVAGITFLFYAKYKKINDFAALMGVIIYLFSFYFFFSMARHPFFINIVILFPILLISVEKMILEDKKVFFIIMVAIMYLISFYFGYMLSIILAIYGIILAFINYDKKKAVSILLKTFLYALVGLTISMVTLLPTIDAFLSSARSGTSLYLYPLYYYANLIGAVIRTKKTGYWSIIGISSIILVLFPIFFKQRKKYKLWYIFFLCLLIPIFIPLVASLFDCLSFPNNRWIFVMVFLLAFISSMILNDDEEINAKKMIIGLGIYSIILLIFYGFDIQWLVSIILSFVFLKLFSCKKKLKNHYEKLMLIVLIINVAFNIFYTFDNNFDDYIHEYAEFNANSLFDDNNHQLTYLEEAIHDIQEEDKGFYNIMLYPNALNNISIIQDYNSTSYYYSVVSKNYYKIAHDLENSDLSVNGEIKQFNYRTRINNLLNNRYLITNNEDYIPYAFQLIKNYNDDTYVYKNMNKTSFSHLYTNSITSSSYENLSPIDKELSLLVNTIGDDNPKEVSYQKTKIPFEINKELNDHSIQIEGERNVSLSWSTDQKGELYLYISNIKRKKDNIFDKNDFCIDVMMNDLAFHEKFENKFFNAYYFSNNDFLINLGYYDNITSNLDIIFSKEGTYSFDEMSLIMVPMDELKSIMNNLYVSESNFVFDDNEVSFDANISNDGILSFTTNYHKNWKIYVDNELVESKEVNNIFLGCDITKGNHHIKLVYKNNLIQYGLYISIIGLIVLGIIIVRGNRKVKQ